ncbi:MAG TPA: histidine--tRNA ligase [Terriglobales bacterium]|nr:histidine--tRNA ligase [Terriglobales bacterium]
MIKAIRGTRDLLPPETALWNFVEKTVRDVFRAYNFQEIRTPIFEDTQLFARGVGEETDIVSKEMYTWSDGERFDEDALKNEWVSRGDTENKFYVEGGATQVNSYLRPLGILLINNRPPRNASGPDKPELVCFRGKATSEAVELLLKARTHVGSAEFVQQYGEDARYAHRARLRIVVPAGTADLGLQTHEAEVELFQNRTPVFKSSQSLTLRPENTAGVVRAYIEHNLQARGLNKLYYIGPQFRRERPQKGRYRQFYQIGAEVIGPTSSGSHRPIRDAEVIEMLRTMLENLGIRDWNLQINSLGDPDDRVAFNQALRDAVKPVVGQMCADCQRRAVTNPLRIFDCKVPEDQPVIERLPKILDHLSPEAKENFDNVQALLHASGVKFEINPRLVRGLDYYTRTAFEFTYGALGAQNALLGGGRYDGLAELLGSKQRAPGVGFAMGEDRLILALQQLSPPVSEVPDAFIAPVREGMNRPALTLAAELRRQKLTIELGDRSFKLGRLLEIASKLGCRYAVIVGENEVHSDVFTVKKLTTGQQFAVPRAELTNRLRS